MQSTVTVSLSALQAVAKDSSTITLALENRFRKLGEMRREWKDDPSMVATIDENRKQTMDAIQAVEALIACATSPEDLNP